MSVSLEYSYNINKDGSEKGNLLRSIAYSFGAKYCDTQYEFEGQNRQISRSHCIIIITFGDDDSCVEIDETIIDAFIKEVSNISRVYLECIYNSENKIIYSSKYFKKRKQTL